MNFSCCILYQRPVPNWLREELLKKKSAPLSASAQYSENLNSMEANDAEQTIGRPDQSDSKSNDLAKSTEDDEDDEVPFTILITVLNSHTIDTVFVCCVQDQPNSILPIYIRGHEERLTCPSY